MNDPKIALYICMEKPHSLIQYGGTIVGPIVNNVLGDVATYMNIAKVDSELEFKYTWMDVKTYPVLNYIGKTKKEIKSSHFKFVYVGNGDKVIYQLPQEGEKIKEGKELLLFT